MYGPKRDVPTNESTEAQRYGEILHHCAALYRIHWQVPESKCITFPYMNNATVFKRPGILKIMKIMTPTTCQQPVWFIIDNLFSLIGDKKDCILNS